MSLHQNAKVAVKSRAGKQAIPQEAYAAHYSSKWISATSEAVIRRDLAKTWWAPLDAMPFPLRLKCAQKEVVVFYGQSGSAIHGHVALLHIHWKFSEKYGIIYAYEYAGVVHR